MRRLFGAWLCFAGGLFVGDTGWSALTVMGYVIFVAGIVVVMWEGE